MKKPVERAFILVIKYMISCNSCKILQDENSYYSSNKTICKSCLIERTKRRNSLMTSDQKKHKKLKEKYNISIEMYNYMLSDQGGVCAICKNKSKDKMLSVDHNHTTGEIRALLCNNCNTAIGHLKESIELLESVKIYLQKYK